MNRLVLPFLIFSFGCASNSSVILHQEKEPKLEAVTDSVRFIEHGCRGFYVSYGHALFEHRVYSKGFENTLTLDDKLDGHKLVLYDMDGDMHVDKISTAVVMLRPSSKFSKSEQEKADELFAKYYSLLEVDKYFELWTEKYKDVMKFY